MTTGMIFLITRPGFITPMDAMPTPDLAVPYAAPISGNEKWPKILEDCCGKD